MEYSEKPDLVINGVTTASGGDYGKVRIDGVGTVEGDIVAESFDANGMTKVRGSLATDDMDCDGMITIDGHVSAGKSLVDGLMKIKGSLKADRFTVNGMLKVKGDCEIEELRMDGGFTIDGSMNVGRLYVMLNGQGRTREIGCESIQVRRKRRTPWAALITWVLPRYAIELHTSSIEGDDIDLEHTETEVVRGNRVMIGKGCRVDLVEYRTELKVHPSAKIGKGVKIGG
ncbi:hypothetical protein [Cohnella terricola]|uniref:Polymer-forming cytoskeletal protein n=1 Tax=Cohnella terricola TaxID=1289167 RepID=A0A559JFH8_9BACL|nr:hypothetical protein [Cohnella terricola]TVX98617.1 hypothetical protein FPZ45_15000 [Cohnella terricola]